MHPDNARTACLAAKIVGLDIAGIDLVAEDISKPLAEQGGAIVEVNAGPSLLMHLKPAVGKPRPVGEAIADHLFPDGWTMTAASPSSASPAAATPKRWRKSSRACCNSMAGAPVWPAPPVCTSTSDGCRRAIAPTGNPASVC